MTTPYYYGEGYPTLSGGPVAGKDAKPATGTPGQTGYTAATPAMPGRDGKAGTGYGIHFNLGNPSQLHEQAAVTGFESEKDPAGTTPYNEPLSVAPLVQQPRDCYGNCQEQERLARVHCDIIRKRVAQWMKDTGCASSVRGFKQKSKCGR